MNPAEGPTAAESTTAFWLTPTITLGVSTSQINEGGSTILTCTISKANPNSAISVNYAMSGTAALGTHYTLSGPAGRFVIPAGASSASVTLNALVTNLSSGSEVATISLQPGTGYRLPPVPQTSVTILNTSAASSPTPTPSPTATPTPTGTPIPAPSPTASPRPTPTQEIWISVRTDGLPGSGTQADPYDGSTPERFDALMLNYYWTYNLGVHLAGPGPFRTYANHRWAARPGWVISGDGMYATTLQMVGSVARMHYGVTCVSSDPNIATDYVTIRDLTIDCNWAQLSITADTGAKGEKNVKTQAIAMWGSNNLIDHVRSINTYGSAANGLEQFAIALSGPRSSDGTNNVIQFCRAEQPYGNYGNPFAIGGWMDSTPFHLLTNSKVIGCTAVGNNTGLNDGFTSGGVNASNLKDCVIDSNTFTDCFAAYYQDTGSCDGVHVTNNTVVRGWYGVTFASRDTPRQNIQITGNTIQIQNRIPNGASLGILIMPNAQGSNVTISRNTITFDTGGNGLLSFWGIDVQSLLGATVTDNTVAIAGLPVNDCAIGTGVTLSNNLQPDGARVPGL